jgi:hypothetical protein
MYKPLYLAQYLLRFFGRSSPSSPETGKTDPATPFQDSPGFLANSIHRNNRSSVFGPYITLDPYYRNIRTIDGEKPVPYHRILLITYDGKVEFENQKIRDLSYQLMEDSPQ